MPDGSMKDRSAEMVEGLRELHLDGLIGVGGDGSLEILRRLLRRAASTFIGIPKTIDNDVGETERAIGYSTAVAIATEALDRLQPTGASHDRVMVLEVMGRDAGHIAIAAGIAGGADIVLIPEVPCTLDASSRRISTSCAAAAATPRWSWSPKRCATAPAHACSASKARGATLWRHRQWLATAIAERTGAEARATVLGHVQRGAQPTAEDRLLASAFGVRAVDLLAAGKADRMVGWWNRTVIDVPLEKVVGRPQRVDPDGALIRTARALGICLGDVCC